jgi:rhamnosyltransferase
MSTLPLAQLGHAPAASLLDRTGLVIPTLDAVGFLDTLLPLVLNQGLALSRVLVIDSSSQDGTADRVRDLGVRVKVIPRNEFNHGGTRRYATSLLPEAEFLVFMTQDAVLASSDAFLHLVRAFEDPEVGMAYGRQLPRPEARAIERHARLVNYPANSALKTFADRSRLGARTLFCSNSFAAYRREALTAVGGFPEDVFFGEDQVVAGRMLIAGWKLAYEADACVFHSHGYSLREEFKRYFDIGIFHARNPWILETFGRVGSEGAKFVRSELTYLRKHEPQSVPSALARTFVKYLAYRIGQHEAGIPAKWKSRLSMQPVYWQSRST